MKRSNHVALWLTGSLAVTGCHQTPSGGSGWGAQPSVDGTNRSQNGYSSYHSTGGGWWHSSGSGGFTAGSGGEEGGVARGGFGGHGFGGGEGGE